ncbi:hypothetical protein GCM10022408_10140 [Hymenobacter fastidiosus]|uniref:Virulence-associated protein E-like domain-containing protein n=1 Tax=Hymenobacter fastidiosus TaxID=486264 RepID=A0ABP7RQQ8_9BACT
MIRAMGNTKKPIPASVPEGAETVPRSRQKLRAIEEHLAGTYCFRYNVVKDVVEWGRVDGTVAFGVLEPYDLNSLVRELEHAGHTIGADRLLRLLQSDFVPRVDPLNAYFATLPATTGVSTIAALAATVLVEDPVEWERFLTKWIVACVANVLLLDGCQNHTCLVLIGGQGLYKTTWLNLLCPPSLAAQYLFTGKIDPDNKDTLSLLAENLLLNIDDQLALLTGRSSDALKTLITLPAVKIRRPYAPLFTHLPRRASFMASVNEGGFLTDATGSRRFLPVHAQQIDIGAAQGISMDHVWAEAYALFRQGYRYWFDAAETEALNVRNDAFRHTTVEYDVVAKYLTPGTTPCTLAELKSELQRRSGLPMLADSKLGAALKQQQFIITQPRSTETGAARPRYYGVHWR